MQSHRSTTARRAFRLKLFDARKLLKAKRSMRFKSLHADVYTGQNHGDSFNLIERTVGEDIGYGQLMTYLFRRFGYPNSGWDDYKELACYQLATPAPDMYMRIAPHVGNTSSISIMFMISEDGQKAIDEYDRQPCTDHEARMHAWIESTCGLPEWADEFVEAVRRDWGTFRSGIDTFQAAFPFMQLYKPGPGTGPSGGDSPVRGIPLEWSTWANEKRAAFEAIDTRPGLFLRSENIEEWPDTDPLKPYALAAVAALLDLKTPVRVRDSAINAFGRVDDPRRMVNEAAVSGFPSGAIGNMAPKEFAQLHDLIMTMGKGDAKRGLAKVLKALGQEA